MDSSQGTHEQRQFHRHSQTFGKIFKGYQVNTDKIVKKKKRHYTGKIKEKKSHVFPPVPSGHHSVPFIPWKAGFTVLDRIFLGGKRYNLRNSFYDNLGCKENNKLKIKRVKHFPCSENTTLNTKASLPCQNLQLNHPRHSE